MYSLLYLYIFLICYINHIYGSFYVQYLNESCYCYTIDVDKIEPINFDKLYLADNFRLSNNNQTFEIFETEYFEDTECPSGPLNECNSYRQSYVSSEECATNDYELVLKFPAYNLVGSYGESVILLL